MADQPSLNLRLIPEYNGSGAQSVVEWIEKLELICKLCNNCTWSWSEEHNIFLSMKTTVDQKKAKNLIFVQLSKLQLYVPMSLFAGTLQWMPAS
ncbi:hypothetical protein E2C01_022388 [Portunus trituberculatus]|uniref:Uncharacterized protein n=1 Tax=Portunus trituberculatus TaxID=210409 RepID=A0A5B7E6X4_PORTR|nr:hypothetical protein [Portunus trituberculatus]